MRTCVHEGRVDFAAYAALREITLDELFSLRDVAIVEADLRWDMTEFRRAEEKGGAGASGRDMSPSQQRTQAKLLRLLPGSDKMLKDMRDAIAIKQQRDHGLGPDAPAQPPGVRRIAAVVRAPRRRPEPPAAPESGSAGETVGVTDGQ